jgi:7-keto-8-aminopelargonate synthetase-like enzyme
MSLAQQAVNTAVATVGNKHANGKRSLLDKVNEYQSANQVRAMGLYPYFRTITSAQDTEVIMNGKKVLMLGSNSYLGLTNHPKIKEATKAAVDKYGSGCAGSRFLNGTLWIFTWNWKKLWQSWLTKKPYCCTALGFKSIWG